MKSVRAILIDGLIAGLTPAEQAKIDVVSDQIRDLVLNGPHGKDIGVLAMSKVFSEFDEQ